MSTSKPDRDNSETTVSLHSQMGARPLSPRPLPASAQRMVMSVRLPSGETGRSHTAEEQKNYNLNQYKQSGISTDKKY
ncbi:hypothetical protein HLH33_16435 [Gluconacetobacter diazotrophicus]|uniref:Uncharacterized protein n=1 Tax=Gluconacetobacter diazotrophicus TaxID=33996 RepID=A0A7W4I7S4_GLUDI|nr:hypothetical protein [Gluconacetobacter diazotrophicus]MBB2157869.1 hypothetical protein [Gluconacetobacter diazotrophicus]